MKASPTVTRKNFSESETGIGRGSFADSSSDEFSDVFDSDEGQDLFGGTSASGTETSSGKILLCAAAQDAGVRLDIFLSKNVDGLSRSRLKSLVESGHVLVDGLVPRPSKTLKGTERISVVLPEPKRTELVPQDIPLDILFEDSSILVISKPAGMVVHPGAGIDSGTVVNAVMFHCRDLPGIGGELRPGIVHRLDKETSGCLVIAKTEQALTSLQAQFQAHTTDKRYLAIVHGFPGEQGKFETLHGRHPTDRLRFTSHVSRGRTALTEWNCAELFPSGASLVSVHILTGRTHQIRMHFSEAGHPLLADALYGGVKREKWLSSGCTLRRAAQALGRQALHAQKLSLDHPVTGERLSFEAPIPQDFSRALQILRKEIS